MSVIACEYVRTCECVYVCVHLCVCVCVFMCVLCQCSDLVANEHAPRETVLSAHKGHVSQEMVPLATGFRNHLSWVEEMVKAFLKVLRTIHSTAVKLRRVHKHEL